MPYEIMEMPGFLDEIKQVTEGTHPRKFCFVLGAGASRASGIQSGQELVDRWEKELLRRNRSGHEAWKKAQGITEENKYSFYSQYYDRRFGKIPRDGYNYMEKMMEKAKPSAGYVVLSYLLANTPHHVVVTTNFDHLTEDAVNYYAQTIPQVIPHEALAHYISGEINRPTIVKIHRDLLLDPRSRPKDLEKLHENWFKALSAIFSAYNPVFIGYAGNDRSLMGFLTENSAKFQSGEWQVPYWMLYQADGLTGAVRDFVDAAGGYVIRHTGFDETMFLIGNALGYQMPTEETFLRDAKERYKTLSDAILNYSGHMESLLVTEKTAYRAQETSDGDAAAVNTAILQITAQADPKDPRKLYQDSRSFYLERKLPEALEAIREAVALEPDNAIYQDHLGNILFFMGRYEEALEAIEKAVSLRPLYKWYLNDLGHVLRALERYPEAVEALEKAAALAPDNPAILSNLANAKELAKEAQKKP